MYYFYFALKWNYKFKYTKGKGGKNIQIWRKKVMEKISKYSWEKICMGEGQKLGVNGEGVLISFPLYSTPKPPQIEK